MTKIIFLDIDGVLNCESSEAYMKHPFYEKVKYVGIDEDKLQNLKYIVDKTNAIIYLTSTWKEHWYKTRKNLQDNFGNEIDKRFAAVGLKVIDKTYESFSRFRGEGIHKVLSELHPDAWVILDDEIYPDFPDYAEEIFPHLIQTLWYGDGLTADKAELAIQVLNGEAIMGDKRYSISTNHHGKE